jgi:hypothetical protein
MPWPEVMLFRNLPLKSLLLLPSLFHVDSLIPLFSLHLPFNFSQFFSSSEIKVKRKLINPLKSAIFPSQLLNPPVMEGMGSTELEKEHRHELNPAHKASGMSLGSGLHCGRPEWATIRVYPTKTEP